MVLTTLATKQLKSFLEANLNTWIQTVATAISETIDPINHWQIGYTNPAKLSTHNALMMFQDVAKPSGEATILQPFNLIAAISGSDSEDVTITESAYFDAVYNLVEADRKLGGICFDSHIHDYMPYVPEERSGTLGVIHIVVNLEIDTLLA